MLFRSGALLLQGAAWYSTVRCYERGGTSSEGGAVAGHHSLFDPPMSSFYFFFSFLWVCVLLPQHVWRCVCSDGCMVVVALFIKLGESLFRGLAAIAEGHRSPRCRSSSKIQFPCFARKGEQIIRI